MYGSSLRLNWQMSVATFPRYRMTCQQKKTEGGTEL